MNEKWMIIVGGLMVGDREMTIGYNFSKNILMFVLLPMKIKDNRLTDFNFKGS